MWASALTAIWKDDAMDGRWAAQMCTQGHSLQSPPLREALCVEWGRRKIGGRAGLEPAPTRNLKDFPL